MFKVVKKATLMVQDIMKEVVREDDTVIDATLGNGNDAVFLSELVQKGQVFAFEIQDQAVERFKDLVAKKNISNIKIIHDGHEKIIEYVNKEIGAAVLNLGYLPGGDPDIITKPETTLAALKSCLGILRPGGVIAIALYTGHQGGENEANHVKRFAEELNSREFSVMDIHYTNKAGKAPYIIVIEKNDSYYAGK